MNLKLQKTYTQITLNSMLTKIIKNNLQRTDIFFLYCDLYYIFQKVSFFFLAFNIIPILQLKENFWLSLAKFSK